MLAVAGLLAWEVEGICAPGLGKGSPVVVMPGDAPVAMVEALEVGMFEGRASTCSKRSLVLVLRRILHRHKLAYNCCCQPISISTQTKLYNSIHSRGSVHY